MRNISTSKHPRIDNVVVKMGRYSHASRRAQATERTRQYCNTLISEAKISAKAVYDQQHTEGFNAGLQLSLSYLTHFLAAWGSVEKELTEKRYSVLADSLSQLFQEAPFVEEIIKKLLLQVDNATPCNLIVPQGIALPVEISDNFTIKESKNYFGVSSGAKCVLLPFDKLCQDILNSVNRDDTLLAMQQRLKELPEKSLASLLNILTNDGTENIPSHTIRETK